MANDKVSISLKLNPTNLEGSLVILGLLFRGFPAMRINTKDRGIDGVVSSSENIFKYEIWLFLKQLMDSENIAVTYRSKTTIALLINNFNRIFQVYPQLFNVIDVKTN